MSDDFDDSEPAPPPAYEGMSEAAMLALLRRTMIATLLDRAKRGVATADDMKLMAKLLKDNGMTLIVEEMRQRVIDVTPEVTPAQIPDFSNEDYSGEE